MASARSLLEEAHQPVGDDGGVGYVALPDEGVALGDRDRAGGGVRGIVKSSNPPAIAASSASAPPDDTLGTVGEAAADEDDRGTCACDLICDLCAIPRDGSSFRQPRASSGRGGRSVAPSSPDDSGAELPQALVDVFGDGFVHLG